MPGKKINVDKTIKLSGSDVRLRSGTSRKDRYRELQ